MTLARELTTDVGIRHWVERMVLKPGFIEKTIANEEVSAINVLPIAGRAGQAITPFTPRASASASATGPILPLGVESNVDQY